MRKGRALNAALHFGKQSSERNTVVHESIFIRPCVGPSFACMRARCSQVRSGASRLSKYFSAPLRTETAPTVKRMFAWARIFMSISDSSDRFNGSVSSRTPHRARCWPAVRPRPSDEDERSSECPGARWPIPASRCVAQTLPERAKLRHALARRVSGDQRAVDRADRCPDHSVRLDACVRERLEDTGLVGAESASALEDEDDLSGKRMSFCLHGPVLFGLMK